jgi:hypothetical protein
MGTVMVSFPAAVTSRIKIGMARLRREAFGGLVMGISACFVSLILLLHFSGDRK